MRPTLRFLTLTLGPRRIGPVVAAGLESIITPHGALTSEAWVLSNLVAVLGALYLYVWRGVTFSGKELDKPRYVAFRKQLGDVLERARNEVDLGVLNEEDAWEGWREVVLGEFDTAMVRIHRHGWFDLEWVGGIKDLVEREARKEAERARRDEEAEREVEEEEEEIEPLKIRRPDTMFQERYDYLSERKRKAYAEWKEGVLKRIKELEKV